MRRVYFLLLLIIGSSPYTAQAQYRGLQPPFRAPSAETNSGAQGIDMSDPTMPRPQPRKSFEKFRIAGEAHRIEDPNRPTLKPEQQEIEGSAAWKFDKKLNFTRIFSYSDGRVYQIVRDSVWGREAYGYGEEYLNFLEQRKFKVKRIGEIDFDRPYVIKKVGSSYYEITTDSETTRPDKVFKLYDNMMARRLIPKMNQETMKDLDESENDVGDIANYKPMKDHLWLEDDGGVFKPSLEEAERILKIADEQDRQAAKLAAQKTTVAQKTKKEGN